MKKMIRSLAALTALALLGAGLIACSSDDGKDPEPGVRIEGSKSVAVDGEITLTAKATDFSGDVTYTWESSDKTKATVTQNASDPSKATVKGIAEGSAKITVKAKAGDTEKTDEVTVTVGTTTSTGGKATAATYSFVGLVFSDFEEGSLIKKDDGEALSAYTTDENGAGNYIKSKTEVTVKNAVLYGGKNNLRIRASNNASTALNYNGGESADISSGSTISGLSRYVKIDVDGAGTVAVEYAGVSSDKGSKTCQIAILDEDGNYLGGETVNTVKDDADVTTKHSFDTAVPNATAVYIAFSRNGASGGGIDLYSIAVTPAE